MTTTTYPVVESIGRKLAEARVLYDRHTKDVPERVRAVVSEMEDVARQVEAYSGLSLRDKDVLDIGPGQLHGFMHWLAARNRAIGIDLDVSPQGLNLADYIALGHSNGLSRLGKTIARKALGADRKFKAELASQLGVPKLSQLDIRQMDATQMKFADSSFDFVFSRSVFEHIADPAAAIQEVVRVLRPGGAAFLIVHLFTSDGGCHDPRIMFGDRSGLPLWAHLRPETVDQVRPNSYLNQLRLGDWREMFQQGMKGCLLKELRETDPKYRTELKAAREKSQLSDYTDAELLTVVLQVQWTKPGAPQT